MEDVVNNEKAYNGAVITDNEEDMSKVDTIENGKKYNNKESKEILPFFNIETIAYNKAQRSDGEINSESIGDKDEDKRSVSAVDENDIGA